jgi:tRNA(Ile)-lysidine synthase
LSQNWREDSSNRHLTFTRNRIRHELLPLLETWNPQLREHLSQMAELARDEEAWWQEELARVVPQLILTGRPVRGGGRASDGDGLSIDVTRLAALSPALQRRLLRHAAEMLGAAPDFAATEALHDMTLTGHAGQKLELANGLRAERTPRELRLTVGLAVVQAAAPEYTSAIPGEILAPGFGLRLQLRFAPSSSAVSPEENGAFPAWHATLRNWKPGDRVRLRYSSGPRKVKEVLERLKVTGTERALWPVLEVNGRLAWMKGVELEPEQGIEVMDIPLGPDGIRLS